MSHLSSPFDWIWNVAWGTGIFNMQYEYRIVLSEGWPFWSRDKNWPDPRSTDTKPCNEGSDRQLFRRKCLGWGLLVLLTYNVQTIPSISSTT